MTALELSEYTQFEDMFPFPSSPDQLALFSPSCSSGEEDYYGVYDQKPYVSKMTNAAHSRAQRQAAAAPVPTSPAMKKQTNQPAPVLVQPSALSPSRVKSTTPDIALLFSLFEVLEDDEQTPSPASSSPSSPSSTSGRQTPEAACVPDRDSYAHAVPTMPIQWRAFPNDPVSMLSSFADVLN